MGIKFSRFEAEHLQAVKEFNRRLREGGSNYRFPENSRSKWLPLNPENECPYQSYHLALDDGNVRGAYILKYQSFNIDGVERKIAYYHLPISEGIVNDAYGMVGVRLLQNALKEHNHLFCLGIGSYEEALSKLLKSFRWKQELVPFFIYINRPFRFLKNVRHLRRSPMKRIAIDALAYSGLGGIGISFVQRIRESRLGLLSITWELDAEFGSWADDVWMRCKDDYRCLAVRDRRTLNRLYPVEKAPYLRLTIKRNGKVIGWALLTDNAFSEHKYFGKVRLGAIVDGLAATEDVEVVIRAARNFLKSRKVDVIVSNQAHSAWTSAIRQAGFMEGPSNFIFASSRKLSELTQGMALHEMHWNRGDGDGPIGL